jgi:hypothetical protein
MLSAGEAPAQLQLRALRKKTSTKGSVARLAPRHQLKNRGK